MAFADNNQLQKNLREIMESSVSIYLLKVNNGNTRKNCEICLKLTIETPEQHQMVFWYLYW